MPHSCSLLYGLLLFSVCSLFVQCNSVASEPEEISLVDRSKNEIVQPITPPNMDGFFTGLSASLYVIIISELGDKTFFIAAIMCMQHPRCLVYTGAMAALAAMTVLSAILGYATTVIPRWLTYYTSGVLFLLFGLKMIYDAYKMSPADVQEEFEEVKQQIAQSSTSVDVESCKNGEGAAHESYSLAMKNMIKRLFSPVLAEAFILTFLAEWGDRSQLTTIVLAATKSVSGVIVGGIIGHALCTGLAVFMGRLIAQRIPVKWQYPASCFVLSDNGTMVVSDLVFREFPGTLKAFYQRKKELQVEGKGIKYKLGDFGVNFVTLFMGQGANVKGYLIEVTFETSCMIHLCGDILRAFITQVLPDLCPPMNDPECAENIFSQSFHRAMQTGSPDMPRWPPCSSDRLTTPTSTSHTGLQWITGDTGLTHACVRLTMMQYAEHINTVRKLSRQNRPTIPLSAMSSAASSSGTTVSSYAASVTSAPQTSAATTYTANQPQTSTTTTLGMPS